MMGKRAWSFHVAPTRPSETLPFVYFPRHELTLLPIALGMGLTGGLADIGGLFQRLEGMHAGLADPSILTTWSDVQVKKWHEIINPISSGNIKRLFDQDPEKALENDDFLKMLKKAETDVELSRQMQASAYDLCHDYSQYFRKADGLMSSRM